MYAPNYSEAVMTKLEDIEKAVSKLAREDLARFRAWFDEFQEQAFDSQIEQDAKSGNLDWLAQEALQEHLEGNTRPLPVSRK